MSRTFCHLIEPGVVLEGGGRLLQLLNGLIDGGVLLALQALRLQVPLPPRLVVQEARQVPAPPATPALSSQTSSQTMQPTVHIAPHGGRRALGVAINTSWVCGSAPCRLLGSLVGILLEASAGVA